MVTEIVIGLDVMEPVVADTLGWRLDKAGLALTARDFELLTVRDQAKKFAGGGGYWFAATLYGNRRQSTT